MIILEGPDGGGKTGLLRRLGDAFPMVPLAPRFATSLGGPLDNLATRVYEDIQKQGKSNSPSFYDRHPIISEYVYGHSIPERTVNQYFLFPSATALRNNIASAALVVWCMPPLAEVTKNVQSNDQMPGVIENIQKIYEGYCIQRVTWPGESYLYDYTNPNLAPIVQAIYQHLAGWESRKDYLNV